MHKVKIVWCLSSSFSLLSVSNYTSQTCYTFPIILLFYSKHLYTTIKSGKPAQFDVCSCRECKFTSVLISCCVCRQNEIEQTEFAGWARMGTVSLKELNILYVYTTYLLTNIILLDNLSKHDFCYRIVFYCFTIWWLNIRWKAEVRYKMETKNNQPCHHFFIHIFLSMYYPILVSVY